MHKNRLHVGTYTGPMDPTVWDKIIAIPQRKQNDLPG